MHVQANIFLTIFFVIFIIPLGLMLGIFFPNALRKHSVKKQRNSYWLKRDKFRQDMKFAKEQ